MSETLSPAARLTGIITTLKRTIRGVGNEARVAVPLLDAIQARLNRLLHRFHSLLLRPPATQSASTLATAAQRLSALSRAGDQPANPDAPTPEPATKIKFPTGGYWLGKLMPSILINALRYEVDHFLAQPDTIALVGQTPQLAAQVFRPLCRFFSLPIPLYLQLPPRPRKPRKPRMRKPKPPKPPKPPEPTLLDYLLAKYPTTEDLYPPYDPNYLGQIRKLFSR